MKVFRIESLLVVVLTFLVLPGAILRAQGTRATLRVTVAEGQNSRIMRVLDDPHLGDRWVLATDQAHPGGPGRLERLQRGASGNDSHNKESESQSRPVVRAGDTVAIEEHTRNADVCLEAVALEPALEGEVFHARLKAGGNSVRAVAAGSGRAVLAPALGAQR